MIIVSACSSNPNTNFNVTLPISSSEKSVLFEDIDSLIKYSEKIVVGTVVSEERFNQGGTYKYVVNVKDQLKSDNQSPLIDVYAHQGKLELDKDYLLFLEYQDNELYPNTIHSILEKIQIKGNELFGDSKFIGNNETRTLINYIKKSPDIFAQKREKTNIKDTESSLNELLTNSNVVMRIIPRNIINENKYIKAVEVSIVEEVKGKATEQNVYLLPSNIEIGKEYIVFLKDREGSLRLTTKKGSIVSKEETETWNKIISQINN